jgi:hypothetical protein
MSKVFPYFRLLQTFREFIERLVPAFTAHIAIFSRRDANMMESHLCLSILVLESYCDCEFQRPISGHAVTHSRNNVSLLVGKAVSDDDFFQGNYSRGAAIIRSMIIS